MKVPRLRSIYSSMKQRCYNQNTENYKYYGGRGVKVCDEWLNSSQAFYDWARSNGYDETLTLDRIDNNGNYEPGNCRWVSMKEQVSNRRPPKNPKFYCNSARSSTGVVGVAYHKRKDRYYAYLGGKYIGCYRSFGEAVAMRKKAETELIGNQSEETAYTV